MKPGPAMSMSCTQRCTASCFCSAATRAVASSRGFFFSARASGMAAVMARSPWLACLGDSKAAAMPAPGASSVRAWVSARCNACLAWIMR